MKTNSLAENLTSTASNASGATRQDDSGYQGLQKLHLKTALPHKRRRKIPLTPEQEAHNTSLSSKRILVEHALAQLKKFKILGSTYRNFRKKLHLRFNIIAGIYNLRFS